jgi:hypothetical protein
MCIEAIRQISTAWDSASNEDKQGMARMLFEHIVYNLDTKRIVDFRLKPWAERYLVLRSALYERDDKTDDESSENKNAHLKETSDLCPIGDSNPCFGLERATSWASRRMGRGSVNEPRSL